MITITDVETIMLGAALHIDRQARFDASRAFEARQAEADKVSFDPGTIFTKKAFNGLHVNTFMVFEIVDGVAKCRILGRASVANECSFGLSLLRQYLAQGTIQLETLP